jgi:beta-lactamase regulating signal transducer with metallopeptidase domain/peroxiredoxin
MMNATLVLLSKVTVVLAMAWILHAILARSNPRWRVLVWRMTALAVVAVAALSLGPPLVNLRVLRARQAMGNTGVIVSTHLNVNEKSRGIPFTAANTAALEKRSWTAPTPASEGVAARKATVVAQKTSAGEGSSGQPWASDGVRPIIAQRAKTTAARVAPPILSPTALTLTCWSIGAMVGMLWTVIGIVRLCRIRADSVDVPDWVASEATAAAERLRLRRGFQIAQTRRLTTPCLIRVWRPLVLLPTCQCETARREELGAILAHELAHLKGNDPAFNLLLHALSIALWFHPLVWFARRAHAEACDYICDALAAGYIEDAEFYGCVLARLALRLAEQPTVVGLAMAARSRVEHRIEAARRKCAIVCLPRWRVAVAVAAAGATSLLWGGLTISETIAEPPAATQTASSTTKQNPRNDDAREEEAKPAKPEPTMRQMTIHAVARETDEPLKGVGLDFHGSIGEQSFRKFLVTDGEGNAQLTWSANDELKSLWMTASKDGFVSQHYIWLGQQHKVEVQDRIELRLDTGRPIGGTVHDVSGQPIVGAQLEIHMPATWPKLANWVFTAATLNTDAEGKWTWADAPADVSRLGIGVSRADYLRGSSSADRGMNNVAVLKKGLEVKGRVVNADAEPVAGAKVRLCLDRFGSNPPQTTTDADGRFVLKNCQPGASAVTVEAEGLSPALKEVVVGDKMDEVPIDLAPGNTLTIKVVERGGKPLADVWVVSDTWRGHRTLELSARTNPEGVVVFRGAPDDAVMFDVLKQGYMSVRRAPLKASSEPHVVVMHPPLQITGRVTDAQSGQPVEQFRVRVGWRFAGRDDVFWSRDEPTPFNNGRYDFKAAEPMEAHVLQIVADGYLAATSRDFKSDEGVQTLDFALEPGTGATGVVFLADGSPAAGAEVGLATHSKRAFLKSGSFDTNQNHGDIIKTDADGRFEFPSQGDEPFLLIFVHESGFAERLSKELNADEPIVLEPWGRIEGLVTINGKPAPDCGIVFLPDRPDSRRTHPYVHYDYHVKSDEIGRFSIDHVIPGKGSVCRVVVNGLQQNYAWQTLVDVLPGRMNKVVIGGRGRRVIGSVALAGKDDLTVDWETNQPAEIVAWDRTQGAYSQPYTRYLSSLDKSGRFNVPDVPAGVYKLRLPIDNPSSPNALGTGTAIGRAELEFTMPEVAEGRSDEPLDLGVIEAKLFDTLDAGEFAPDFVAEQLSGGSLRMSKLRGTLVLLDFWATWCAPCLPEMQNRKKLHQEFGNNPRFAILSLSCDNTAGAANDYVKANGFSWTHAFAGGTQNHIPTAYTVRSLPATFLIAPDGRVISKNLRGDELRKAVAAALADDKLFDNAGRPFARFPITRFEAGPAKPLASKPGIVVLDDTDPDFDNTKPHHDGLRLLSQTGDELWSMTDLNNAQTVGGVHRVVIDRRRERVYVCESVGNRIIAFRLDGQKLWQVEQVEADAIAFDERTGNVWTSGGRMLNDGESVVFDPEGNEVAAYPFRAIDLAYDPHDDAFWLAGYETIKLSRNGNVLFRQRVDGWCCASLSVNPNDGSVWLAERAHPDVPRAKNRVWLLNADGSVRHKTDLGEFLLFGVACVPQTGGAWVAGLRDGVRFISAAGEVGEPLPMTAYALAVSPTTGAVWVSCDTEVLQLAPSGKTILRLPFAKPSQQSWIEAF